MKSCFHLHKHMQSREILILKLILWLPVLVALLLLNGVNASHAIGSSRLADKLESNSESVKKSIITNTEQQQSRNARRQKLQMQADQIRTQLFGATDATVQASLSTQLQTVEKQIKAIR